jgi:raffinose/stachyose/melibiose transport system permease protein
MSSSIFKKSVYFFAIPALLFYMTFWVVPIIMTFYLSFTDSNGLADTQNFIGWNNYAKLSGDGTLANSLRITFIYTALSIVLINLVSLAMALILNMQIRGKGFYRTAYYIPTLISSIVIGFVWGYVYAPSYGMIASLLGGLGLEQHDPNLLGNPDTSLYATVLVEVWKGAGAAMIIYLAGLQSIPEDLLEAAKIDGCGGWKVNWHIRFPLLASALTINVVLALINGLKAFDFIFIMTQGGPAKSTETLLYAVYKMAFVELNFGKGAALGVVVALLTLVLTVGILSLLRRREVEA